MGAALLRGRFTVLVIPMEPDTRCSARPQRPRAGKRGAALVLVLLLTGFVAALTVQSQRIAAAALRRSRLRQARCNLRLAAADAAWYFLRDQVRPASAGAAISTLGGPVKSTLPSGAQMEVAVSEEMDQRLLALSALAGAESGSRLYLLTSSAAEGSITERVRCLFRRNRDGKTEIVGWHEFR